MHTVEHWLGTDRRGLLGHIPRQPGESHGDYTVPRSTIYNGRDMEPPKHPSSQLVRKRVKLELASSDKPSCSGKNTEGRLTSLNLTPRVPSPAELRLAKKRVAILYCSGGSQTGLLICDSIRALGGSSFQATGSASTWVNHQPSASCRLTFSSMRREACFLLLASNSHL